MVEKTIVLYHDHIYQPLRSGQIWHKVNFKAWFTRFEFRVFLLLDELSHQGWRTQSALLLIGFIPFSKVLVLREMQPATSRIWTRIAVSISDDDNHYTTGTSNLYYLYCMVCKSCIKSSGFCLNFYHSLVISSLYWSALEITLKDIFLFLFGPFFPFVCFRWIECLVVVCKPKITTTDIPRMMPSPQCWLLREHQPVLTLISKIFVHYYYYYSQMHKIEDSLSCYNPWWDKSQL